MKLPQLSACFVSCVVLGADASANSWSDSTTVLVYNFGRSVQIPDADGNGQITDGDFVHWLSDYMFSRPVQDENADGVVNYTDVVLTVEGTLKSLASDFNRNDVVDTDDFANVLQNLGTTEPDADKGDLNADGAVYIDCTDDCEDTYDTCLPNCRAAYQLCKDAAELVLQTCEGSCSGNCDSSVGCAARCLGCRVVFGAQMSMCLAMLTGCMTGCELGLTTCFSGCYLGSIQSFPGAVCPPGWIPVF